MSGRYHVPDSSAHPSATSVLARYSGWRTIEYAPSVDSESAWAAACRVRRCQCGAVPTTSRAQRAAQQNATSKTEHLPGERRRRAIVRDAEQKQGNEHERHVAAPAEQGVTGSGQLFGDGAVRARLRRHRS